MDENELELLIPSKAVREYILETGRVFTDMEKAAILSHHDRPDSKYRDALKSLRDTTADEKLRHQIIEYLEREEKAFELFKENADNSSIYIITYREEPEYDEDDVCYFSEYETAVNFGRRYKFPFQIEKHPLMSAKVIDEFEDGRFYDYELGTAWFDENGDIDSFWSNEIETIRFDSDRFEDMYYYIPCPFDIGDVVKILPIDARDRFENPEEHYAIVCNTKEACNDRKGYDFSDVQIKVAYPDDDGYFSHSHVNPMYLERYEIPERDKDRTPLEDFLYWTGRLLKGKFSVDGFCFKQIEYADHNEKLESAKKLIRNADKNVKEYMKKHLEED